MSDTDDTDVLLLIPPNFFLVHSSSEDSLLESSRTVVHKPVSCTAQVLDKLVTQVHTLESRLESLEISSDLSSVGRKSRNRRILDTTDSFDSHSLDRKSFTFPRRRRRRQRKDKRDFSLTSLDSVSLNKSVPPLKLDRLTNHCKDIESIDETRSMDDISSIVSTPSKNNDKLLLNEIDEFLTKVETYESPDSKFKEHYDTLTPDNIIKAAGDYITQKLESKHEEQVTLPSGRVVSTNVLDKYIYLVKGNPTQTEMPSNTYKSQYSDPSTSKQVNESLDKTVEPSKLDSKSLETKSPSIRRLNFSEKTIQPTSTPIKTTTQSHIMSNFRPSSNKVYDRATKILEQYKAQSSRMAQSSTDSYNMPSPRKEEFKLPQMRPYSLDHKDAVKMQQKLIDSIDTDLLSLSELWGERGEKLDKIDNIKLEEERLKREHCEALIQQLQKKLLEQQQKLAVAMKVDRGKDLAIGRLKEAWVRITGSLERAEERHRAALNSMVREVDNFRVLADDAQKKTNHFETELYKALDLAHDYQEKCKQLSADKQNIQDAMEKALAAKQDIINSKDKEIEVLRENYETVMRLNKQSTDCVKNLEEALEKEKSEHEQTKQKTADLQQKIQHVQDEMAIVVQERDLQRERVSEERARCSVLERQLADKQNQASQLLDRCDTLDSECKSLRQHLEVQKSELKAHYQAQLEAAVASKLREFQAQLDAAETQLAQESRDRELALGTNFNKHMARIEDQHKLEVKVLEEKHREEIKLHRLQLAQAAEKIELLESKLSSFRRRRGELAAQLHGVMETQWRHALRILAGGHSAPDPRQAVTPAAENYEPAKVAPLTIPADKPVSRALPALNFDALSDTELQHYVKLLLTKPATLDGSGDSPAGPGCSALEEPTSDRPERRESGAKRNLSTKPPWKA